MIRINNELLDEVCMQAKSSPRKRKNFNFHKVDADTLQRMLNAMEPGTYVRPHKHENPDKREAFIILRGRMAVVIFDGKGQIITHTILDNASGNYGVEIPPRAYHTVISLEPNSVVYELKDGPYDASIDKGFAEWAPEEGAIESGAYLSALLNRLNLQTNF